MFNGKDGEFILAHGIEAVRWAMTEGSLSKRKAYAIVKAAPDNASVQNAALFKSREMSADELKIFAKILANQANKKEPTD